MTAEALRSFLAWCTLINGAILLFWWIAFLVARDGIIRLHARQFRIAEERFDEIHYRSMALFKLGILLFNLTPYLVLRFTI